jgi:teichoic acid transport system permease protein
VTAVGHNPTLDSADLQALAVEHGLRKVGGRPPLRTYVKDLWKRRHFTLEMARGMTDSSNEGHRLGQLWELLTPMLWAGLYLFIFGVVVKTKAGTHNFVGYLVTGLFIFRYVAGCMSLGAKCIRKSQGLITSLQFPRALVPMAACTAELISLVPALFVMFALALWSHEPIRWQMLLVIPAIGLMFVFTLGLAMAAARVVDALPDLANMIPFITRFMMYVSGVFFSIEHFAGHGWLGHVLTYQPLAIYIELARSALLEEVVVRPTAWLWALGWTSVMFTFGFIFFWRAEARYGRG